METAGILAKLGLNNSEFKAKLKDAGEEVKGFEKGWKDIGKLFAAGGMTTAVVSFFTAAIEGARESKDELDKNVQAVRRFGDTVADLKGVWSSVTIAVTGTLNSMGEMVGRGLSVLWYGEKHVKLTEQIEQQTRETLATIEKEKKIAEEVNKIRNAIKEVEEKATEEANKQLTISDQILIAVQKHQAAVDAVAAVEGDKVALAKAQLVAATELASLQKLYGAKKKEDAENEKKSTEEHAKVLAKLAKQIEEDDDEERERSLERGRIEREQAEAQAAAGIEAQEAYNAEVAAAEELLRLQYQLTEATKDFISIKTVGQGDTEISDAQLKAKIANLESDIGSRKAATYGSIGGVGGAGGWGNDPFIALEGSYLQGAQKELEAREQLRRYVANFGEEGAARFYQSNLPEFERLMEFVKASPEAKKTNDTLKEINDRLSMVLPRY